MPKTLYKVNMRLALIN